MPTPESPRNVFGPVPSRRLGQSLGVDPFPQKVCNYNCVYCQLGRTQPLRGERRDLVPPERILGQIEQGLAGGLAERVDYLTFVGRGEPLLCASLGWLIRQVKGRWPSLPVAVITNGSLLDRPEVREELASADLVMPTLDAADQATFRRINRPLGGLEIAAIIDGMVALRRQLAGRLWVEVMLVPGLNDDADCLAQLRDALERIAPDQVHINVAARPPAEGWVEVPDSASLARAVRILGQVAEVVAPETGSLELGGADGDGDDVVEAVDIVDIVRSIVGRHPMREADLLEGLERRFGAARTREVLAELEGSGQLRRHVYRGEAFWGDAGS